MVIQYFYFLKIYIIFKSLSLVFIVAMFMLSHIKIAFWSIFNLVWFNSVYLFHLIYSVHCGPFLPFRSSLVNLGSFGLIRLIWSSLVHFVHLSPIRSISVNFGSPLSVSVHTSPFGSFWSNSAHLFHFGLFQSTLMIHCGEGFV